MNTCAVCKQTLPAPGCSSGLRVRFSQTSEQPEWSAYLFCGPPCLNVFLNRGASRAILWDLTGRADLSAAAAGDGSGTRVILDADIRNARRDQELDPEVFA